MYDEELFRLGANPKTLARKKDPQTSKNAAKKMVKSGALSRQEDEVLYVIEIWYSNSDFTTKEIAVKMLGYPYHKAYDICRKLFSRLANKGKIELVVEKVDISRYSLIVRTAVYKNKRRDGCRVWRLL